MGTAKACCWGVISVLSILLLACAPPPEMLEEQNSKPAANTTWREFKTDLPASPFVSVEGNKFYLQGKPYRYVGANMWYAAYLGSSDSAVADRARLQRELDTLQQYGITNLRILGAAERSPLDNSLQPAISYRGKVERDDLLEGLDFTLAEMAKRDMKAVIYLNNFWEWSGGMMTYLSWVNGGDFINLGDDAHPWPAFALATAKFYSNSAAVDLSYQYMETLLTRTNSITGVVYKDDPAIMAWQLANEPRPGDGDISRDNLPAYFSWIRNTAALIKQLDPNHLVSLGSEGTQGCLGMMACFLGAHAENGIDYATVHLWPKNWGWFDVARTQQTFGDAMRKTDAYIAQHITYAEQLNMPLVLEEFGFERDGGEYSREADVSLRNNLYQLVYARVAGSSLSGGSLVGSNFWAWGGAGKAQHADHGWQAGDTSYLGDPPQEPQGFYSVFDTDMSTLEIIREHSRVLANPSGLQPRANAKDG
ncbi:glycoside hydrolase 5 family protein [Teredinibacter turnerae]|uniref:glycoside hydrolase 5 family protein n=1 Tax=Teredinibacter turnerae TaxID=2426 RepID=UPI00038038DB|nr:cellulase family glycosylhydrolase [Teredinibacter turnerae]